MTTESQFIRSALDSARARLRELGKDEATEKVLLEALRASIDDLSALLPLFAADHIRYLTLPPELRRIECGLGEMEFEIRNLRYEQAVANVRGRMNPLDKARLTRAEVVIDEFLSLAKMEGSDRRRLWKIVFGFAQRRLPEKAIAAASGRHRDTCRVKLNEHLAQIARRYQSMSSQNS